MSNFLTTVGFHVRPLLMVAAVPVFVPTIAALVVAALAVAVFALTTLENGRPRATPATAPASQPEIEDLSSPDETEVLGAIDAAVQRGQRVPTLVLYHPNPTVVQRALTVLDGRDLHNVMPYLLSHRDEGVRLAAMRSARA